MADEYEEEDDDLQWDEEEGEEEEEEEEEDFGPPPLPPTIHPDRCPPLDLAFMWRIHQKRHTSTVRPQDIPQANEKQRRQRIATLREQGFPPGLASLILQHSDTCPIRILLVDNSATMNADDATLVTQSSSGKIRTTDCTRWEALSSCLIWHAEMAAWLQIPTVVRLLQDPGASVGPQQLGISSSKHYSSSEELKRFKHLLRGTSPNGAASTTLCEHMEHILPSISELVEVLREQDRRLVLCVFTDSIPLDDEGLFGGFLSMLRGWPVQVVLRLSTAEERVWQFYRSLVQVFNMMMINPVGQSALRDLPDEGNTLDGNNTEYDVEDEDEQNEGNEEQLDEGNEPRKEELQLLGDFMTEVKKVQTYNNWLNYGFPLHLCREEGIGIFVVECLSQRPLQMREVLQVANCIFGVELSLPSSMGSTDFREIRNELERLNSEAGVLWSPIKKKFVPWIDLKRLDKMVLQGSLGGSRKSGRGRGDKSCCVM